MKPCFGLLMLVFIACNDAPPAEPDPSVKSTETSDTTYSPPVNTNEETDALAPFMPGYYTGLSPCADCKNIIRKILFLPDHHFHLMDEYDGKEAAPVQADGQWQTKNNQLQLLVNNAVTKRFAVTTKGLSELNSSGKAVSSRPDVYLTRKMIGSDNKAWMEKKAAGIDFFSLGNEPFWLMEIDKDKQISFLRIDNEKPVLFPYMAAQVQNGQWTWNVQTETDKLQIVISNQFCSDGMSDNWYEYKVDVNYNGTAYTGCGVKLNELPE
jgi:uncharacterized membrane protein